MKNLFIFLILLLSLKAFSQSIDSVISKSDFVYFEFNKYNLTSNADAKLNELLDFAKVNKTVKINIIGHTDSIGTDSFNEKLSQNRAQTVYNYFIKNGNPKGMLSISFYGKTKPIEPNVTAEGRQKNRRVEIQIQYQVNPVIVKEDKPKNDTIKLETGGWNDTTFYGSQGTEVIVGKDFFKPYKTSDVSFTITEAFSPCQIISQGLNSMDTQNGCLQTAGMVSFNVTINSKEFKPDGKQTIEVWIPTKEPDKKMIIYIPESEAWKSTKIKPEIKQKNGIYYYVFETELVNACNLDRLVGPCPPTGTIVKTKKFPNQKVYFNYGDATITTGSLRKNKTHQMPNFETDKIPEITAIARTSACIYVAKKSADKIKFKARKNLYVLKRKDYIRIETDFAKENKNDFLCRNFHE